MAWYRTGTVTVTNGSATVTGAGTDFVANTQIGEVFLGPDGRVYEIAGVQSATQLSIIPNYLGGTAGAQGYGIQPTASFARDLALGVAQLLNTFGAVRDGIGQGMFPDGVAATPGLRFAADQDTGLARIGENQLALITGGSAKLTATAANLILGAPFLPPAGGNPAVAALRNDAATSNLRLFTSFPGGTQVDLNSGMNGVSNSGFDIRLNDVSRLAIDASGNLLLGVTSGSSHSVSKASGVGGGILNVVNSAVFSNCDSTGHSAAAAALKIWVNSTTGRSINASGTINASGADYAEYMTKSDGCGTIAAGDVCGVDRDGRLTRTWADAVSFVVKSTDPAYVGGDVWAAHLPPKPADPGSAPAAPVAPAMPDGENELELAGWRSAMDAYPALVASHQVALADWQAAKVAYDVDLPAWEAELEAARQTVDRIAFAGQVPVNIDGDFAVGDYLIAAANGGGIHAVAVAEADITFAQYRRRLGKVWAIRGGRPWIDVQHG